MISLVIYLIDYLTLYSYYFHLIHHLNILSIIFVSFYIIYFIYFLALAMLLLFNIMIGWFEEVFVFMSKRLENVIHLNKKKFFENVKMQKASFL